MSDLARTVFVGNLVSQTTEKDLHDLFLAFGDIKGVELVRDEKRNPKGFGYVDFEEEEDAQEAIFNMDGAEFFGKPLKVQLAKRRQAAPLDKAVWDTEEYQKKYLDLEKTPNLAEEL